MQNKQTNKQTNKQINKQTDMQNKYYLQSFSIIACYWGLELWIWATIAHSKSQTKLIGYSGWKSWQPISNWIDEKRKKKTAEVANISTIM